MNELELNQKLAEWRGFECVSPAFLDTSQDPSMYYPASWKLEGIEGDLIWLVDCPPDFTHSLDACLRWLVPKVDGMGYSYELLQWNNGQHKAMLNKRCEGWAQTYTDVVAETPAMALCLAIERLIDGEAK